MRIPLHTTISEESEDSGSRKPLVTTQFVPWSCRYFAQQVMNKPTKVDMHSQDYFDKEWRLVVFCPALALRG